jgi:hypothetical protein
MSLNRSGRFGGARNPSFGPTDDMVVKKGGIFTFEDGQKVFTDGAGHKTWFATASAAAKTITLPSAEASVGTRFTVKRQSGPGLALKVVALSGTLDGTATYTIATQYEAKTFESDGTNYNITWDYQPDVLTLGYAGTVSFAGEAHLGSTLLVSATLSAGFLQVHNRAFFSATLDALAQLYVSATASVGALQVHGQAFFSATLDALAQFYCSATASVGALQITGKPAGLVQLGSVSSDTLTALRFSGSWSDYAILELIVGYRTNAASNTASIGIYTDGDTTAILNQNFGTVSNAAAYHLEVRIFNASARKSITGEKYSETSLASGHTATANTGFVNALQLTHGGASNTMTLCTAVLYGWRR